MNETLKMINYMVRTDPAVIVGFMLIAISAVLFANIQFKMLRAGYDFPYVKYLTKRNWAIPLEYLRVRTHHGWSPWPAYLILPTGVIGIICLLIGLLRL